MVDKAELPEGLELVGFDLAEGVYTDVIYKELSNFALKTQKLIKPLEIKFHLRKLRDTGKPLYAVDGKVVAGGQVLDANVEGYGLMDLIQEVMNKLETQVMKLKR